MKYAFVAILSLLAAGCAPKSPEQELEALEQRIAKLEMRANLNAYSIERLLKRVGEKANLHESAFLTVGDSGYSIARNEFGVFLFILDDIQPYLDGHKAYLRIANLTPATMTGVSLEFTHGLRYPDPPKDEPGKSEAEKQKEWQVYDEKNEAVLKGRRKLVVPIKNELNPGSWTRAEVVITPCKPDELGYIEMRLSNTGVKLPNEN